MEDPDTDCHFLNDSIEIIEASEKQKIFIHNNELTHLLPNKLPASAMWPPIVYLRIFAPFALKEYDRVLYLDADIAPLRVDHKIWSTNLPAGIAAVSDFGMIANASIRKVSIKDWVTMLGIRSERYFNSGVMLIDPKRWIEHDFRSLLKAFVDAHENEIIHFDQDFLNWVFQDAWVELHPSWNFQAKLFNANVEELFPPIFLHFSKAEKPWHRLHDDNIDDFDRCGFLFFQRLLGDRFDALSSLFTEKKPKFISRLKAISRSKLSKLGIQSRKEKRLRAALKEGRNKILKHLENGDFIDKTDINKYYSDYHVAFDGKTLRKPVNIEKILGSGSDRVEKIER
ncbi:glycosyltransferase [Thioclava sp. F28-4]|uniref:glycosyltransferase family 8 protein n=1 Tax=Thioclava sp. F28-4 TaxID=1915315 RepID=UPI00143B2FD7|nr:glycosyltransferase [Thioclava sp. F28-4]